MYIKKVKKLQFVKILKYIIIFILKKNISNVYFVTKLYRPIYILKFY